LNRKQHKTNEKCITRSFTRRSSSPNIGDLINDDNIGRACGMCIKREKRMQSFCRENVKKKLSGRPKHRWEKAMKMDQTKVWTV
jgi:hypothetical protein